MQISTVADNISNDADNISNDADNIYRGREKYSLQKKSKYYS